MAYTEGLVCHFGCVFVRRKIKTFVPELSKGIGMFLLFRAVKKDPTDRPWITNKIKMWIRKRQATFIQQGKNSIAYRLWRNKVQCALRTAKYFCDHNRVAEEEQVNPATWRREIKSDGQEKSTKILISWQELKNQFLSFSVHR